MRFKGEKRSGHNSRSNEDIGWRFGIAIDGSRKQVQCKFCSKVIRGGITRLKQHLAHKTGDTSLLIRDLEDEITRSFNRDDYVDDEEEEDAQLAHARYQSLKQHRFEHDQRLYRASRGINYDEGGSSRPQSVPQMRRSATVRETSSRGSRDMAYEQMSTPAARLRAVEVEFEKDRTRTKQSKVNSSWLKAAKNKLIKAFGSCVIDTNVPFTVVDSVYTNPLLETIRYFFNPQYMYRQSQDWEDREVSTGVQNVIMRLEPDVDKQIKAMRQIFLYKDRMNSFGSSIAQRAITSLMPGDDLNWLNLDENEANAAIDIEADDDPQPDATAPFRYSGDQQPQDMQGSDYE
ncbi:hypothetical protein Cgig2_030841 [Carnegiea gigantea]|uniref:BED-type domain-containing protein n=1 Tax=Carnegiea gigantea TaxID=171969 RepID=A0A9Q1GNM2_9CARY|nr:hypothetical protein Cgig2_030841 [Carnegiea gigantea]